MSFSEIISVQQYCEETIAFGNFMHLCYWHSLCLFSVELFLMIFLTTLHIGLLNKNYLLVNSNFADD